MSAIDHPFDTVANPPMSANVCAMSAEPVEPPRTRSFRDASPREIRAALIPEEQVDFDVTWQAAMTEAAEKPLPYAALPYHAKFLACSN